ncbi:MAG: nucleoside-diphosphate kinase [Patescibacteria group bacterium]
MKERLQKMLGERTLVLIKPDAVKRGLVGIICQRFEQTGLKIVAWKMVFPNRKQLDGHFPKSEDWVRGMGEKTLETYQEYEIDPVEILGTADPLAIGLKIKEWNYHYLTLGPVMVMVLQGIHAIDTVRKLIGHTLPYKAAPGTIRGDFSINAPDLANVVGSACKNLVHASGNQAEAEQEITNWFEPTEILSWERIDEFLHFVQGEFTTTEKETTMNKYTALEQIFESLKKVDPRNAAEHAYALAALYRRDGNNEEAIRFGREAIALFDKCPMETAEDCASRNVVIEGIAMPSSFIHQDVVRDRLKPLVL